MKTKVFNFLIAFLRWFDAEARTHEPADQNGPVKQIDWVRCIPFIAFHGMCLFAFYTGVSAVAVWSAIAFYFIRMFAITGVYHRYFSHKTYHTSRAFQFLLAVLGATAVQRGALWWAAHHRNHHLYSDTPKDIHSPRQYGLFWAHMGWIMNKANFDTHYKVIPDFAKYPELVFLNRFDMLVPILTGFSVFYTGVWLEHAHPALGTNGFQMLIWAFFISTTVLFHGTFVINSLAHVIGRQRFNTGDDSKNSFWLSMITLGEGWHNNHHYYPVAVRQGFYWWEIDITYYVLKALSWMGLVWDLRPVPKRIYEAAKQQNPQGEPAVAA